MVLARFLSYFFPWKKLLFFWSFAVSRFPTQFTFTSKTNVSRMPVHGPQNNTLIVPMETVASVAAGVQMLILTDFNIQKK